MTDQSVSVVIPCYNAGKTIEKAINSVLTGSKRPEEILVYDDCSSDGTKGILERIASRHESVRVIDGDQNRGAGFARSRLLEEARGDFIAFLDADDWWYHNKLEKQIARVESDGADIVTCHYDLYDCCGSKLGTRKPLALINKFTMHLSNWLPTSMTIVRSSLVGARQMPLIRRRQDYAYWLNLFRENGALKCVVVEEALGGYLRQQGSLSSSPLKNAKTNYQMFRDIMGYGVLLSMLCLLMNTILRLFRK